jgi:stage II sporulation protein D
MNRLIILILILILASCLRLNAQKVSISLFNEFELQTVLITPVSGRYSIIMENQEFILSPNQIVYVSRSGDSVMVRDMASNLGKWERISLVGLTGNDVIRVSPITPSSPARVYDDNLGFYVDFNRMMTINLVDQQKYIAGVVEAESGPSAHLEFYKAQALLAYTYGLGHMERHSGEGFNLCDGVHCQVYKGKSTQNPDIVTAAEQTNGLVVVDASGKPITGAFHANCGGQTASSEAVWLRSRPYLESINDPHCRNRPSSQWEERIPITDWRAFLESKGVNLEGVPDSKLAFTSKNREYYYTVADQNIRMTDIRSHFKLRSSFFTVDVTSNTIRLRGRGYGHGVGMCQDGAIQMARRGNDFKAIINHYFSGVRIINVSELEEYNITITDE